MNIVKIPPESRKHPYAYAAGRLKTVCSIQADELRRLLTFFVEPLLEALDPSGVNKHKSHATLLTESIEKRIKEVTEQLDAHAACEVDEMPAPSLVPVS